MEIQKPIGMVLGMPNLFYTEIEHNEELCGVDKLEKPSKSIDKADRSENKEKDLLWNLQIHN